ncbi:FG-GAP repeat domain-containing protein, partial [Actinoplanes sp. NPDC049265]|uniref:FG-GAP repeat domain-containing protein n=1 Tax=Actinoplanes sp. NPDC049265 TaxID=3363902 RepID=UPI003724A733
MRVRTVAVMAAIVCGLTSVAGVPAYAADPPPIAEEGESQYALTGEPLGVQQLRTEQQRALAAVPTPRTPRFGPSIDGYAANDPQNTCQSGERPGPVALRALLNDTYDLNRTGNITRGCDVGGTSEHKEGRALDYMLDSTDAHERDIAETVVDWMLATDQYGNKHAIARRMGIMYIIWNRRIWSSARASEGWRTYSGSNPHTDHVHFSFGWPGARKETTWWTGARSGASADFNGDGTSDIGVYRVNAGQWHILNLRNREQIVASYEYGGDPSDIPLSGDFDGDGYTDIALYRKGAGQWHIKSTHRNVQIAGSLPYGGDPSDVPVVGDFNGDGFDDIGVYR